jgi:general stress protein YciG
MTNPEGKKRRGFASMTSEKQREIASKGGRAAHIKGTAHEWTPDEARSAGRKGAHATRNGRNQPEEPGPGKEPGQATGDTATPKNDEMVIPERRPSTSEDMTLESEKDGSSDSPP